MNEKGRGLEMREEPIGAEMIQNQIKKQEIINVIFIQIVTS